MKAQELTVEVKAKLDVDRQTAETCFGLAAIYANAHGCRIFGERADDGDIHYWIAGGGMTIDENGIVSTSRDELMAIWLFDNDLFRLFVFADWVKWCRITGVNVHG